MIKFTETPKFQSIPEYGAHMTLREYIDCVTCGGFIDDDGFGELATETQVSEIEIYPSHLNEDVQWPEWCTHIVWYNK
jgi:hypothetical protein